MVTESVFAIPGLGRLTVDAILRRDYPVIQGVVLLFSFIYVLVNLAVDLLYTRVRPEDPAIERCHANACPISWRAKACHPRLIQRHRESHGGGFTRHGERKVCTPGGTHLT